MDRVHQELPPIPAKRYFTIGEVSELCLVKPYVLRYWEQEFVQLKPMKRRGNRRYYQHHEVLLIRRIRELLYEQGFTISGARNRLTELGHGVRLEIDDEDLPDVKALVAHGNGKANGHGAMAGSRALQASAPSMLETAWLEPQLRGIEKMPAQAQAELREALLSIRDLLS